MPSIESLPGEFGGTTNSMAIGSNGGFERDADTSRDTGAGGGSGSKLRDPGSSRRRGVGIPGVTRGLEGVISSSRMKVGSSSERGAGRAGIKMPRPKTAGATFGRGGSVLSTGSTEGVRRNCQKNVL